MHVAASDPPVPREMRMSGKPLHILRVPAVGSSCARVTNGHAAAVPSAAMNSRRRIHPSRTRVTLAYSRMRVATGASGFLIFTQSGDRPDQCRWWVTACT
jgi:hypothetical protein